MGKKSRIEIYKKIWDINRQAALEYLLTQDQETINPDEADVDALAIFLLEIVESLNKLCKKAIKLQCPTIHHILISLMGGVLNPEDLIDYSKAMLIVQRKKAEIKLANDDLLGKDVSPEAKEKLKTLLDKLK